MGGVRTLQDTPSSKRYRWAVVGREGFSITGFCVILVVHLGSSWFLGKRRPGMGHLPGGPCPEEQGSSVKTKPIPAIRPDRAGTAVVDLPLHQIPVFSSDCVNSPEDSK